MTAASPPQVQIDQATNLKPIGQISDSQRSLANTPARELSEFGSSISPPFGLRKALSLSKGPRWLGLGLVAHRFDVMSVRTNDESCIIVRVVFGA